MDDLVQRIYDAPGNRAPKGWIWCVLNGIESAGLIVVDPKECWPGTEIPRPLPGWDTGGKS